MREFALQPMGDFLPVLDLNATRSERRPDDRIYTHPGLNKETGQSSAISGNQ